MIIVAGVHDTLFYTYFKNWLIVVLSWPGKVLNKL